ncbi:hydroxyacid dehydrogenase [Candidatus Saccharibacteria bacterium]|nr:hydroxyacid dehydrogenase [Candidatus Saccharibacteria bacterium]
MTNLYCYEATPADQAELKIALTGLEPIFIEAPLSAANVHSDAAIICVFVSSKVTAEVMAAMPELKLIATRSTGTDHIDTAYAAAHGVKIASVATYGEHTVAEYSFALLLALGRKIAGAQALMIGGDASHDDLTGIELFGRTLGIIGTGRIGLNTARIGRGFGMNVIGYDPYPNHNLAAEIGFSYASLDEVLATSDVISLHVPATPETRHLINQHAFSLMKPTAIIVNSARGEIIHTDALIEALQNGHLAGAALDVVEDERLASLAEELSAVRQHHSREALRISVLERLPGVLMTNHNAYNTIEARQRIAAMTAHNIRDFISTSTSEAHHG